MLIFPVIIIIEVLSFIVLKEYWYNLSRSRFFVSLIIHICLSLWLWFLLIKITVYRGFFDTPVNVSDHMNLMGMISGVVLPRFLVITAHYAGKLFRIRKGGHLRWLTWSGLIISFIIFTVIALGTFIGRFNFRTEEVTVKIPGLEPELNGLKIVQISDLHLAGFYRHSGRLQEAINEVNSYHPDLIINTGDFISYGWREFDRFDTILVKGKSRFGNFAIPGNHDAGTYFPGSSEADKKAIALKVNELMTKSGYEVLNEEHVILKIKDASIALIGVETSGRHPDIIHSDLKKAMEGIDSADLKILLAHDPNQWREDVTGKTDIDLTLSGHTHGMQMGIITKKIKWSPSKYYYPEWSGLYSQGNQFMYVNRGLGVMAIPFRIWMPPEITVLTLVTE